MSAATTSSRNSRRTAAIAELSAGLTSRRERELRGSAHSCRPAVERIPGGHSRRWLAIYVPRCPVLTGAAALVEFRAASALLTSLLFLPEQAPSDDSDGVQTLTLGLAGGVLFVDADPSFSSRVLFDGTRY